MKGTSRAILCSLCGRSVDPRVMRHRTSLERPVRRRLRARHPELERRQRLCPECVQEIVRDLVHDRGLDVLHERVQATWPVDPRRAYGVLPLPLRLHANPFFTGRGICMAFLDSGFFQHQDLGTNPSRIRAYVDASTPHIVEHSTVRLSGALSWHGLMTTSVAAGSGSLAGGRYRGLAPDADLVLVRVADPRGGVHDIDIERGLRWILRNHERFSIRVVNLSVGGDEEVHWRESPVDRLVHTLVQAGLVVVCAAGNAGARRIVPPASAPSAITVGGLDDRNMLDPSYYQIWHSNYGPTLDGVVKPEVVAPSIWVGAPLLPGTPQQAEAKALQDLLDASDEELAAVEDQTLVTAGLRGGYRRRPVTVFRTAARRRQVRQGYLGAHYRQVEGTSFAAPIVASTVATLLEANPSLRPDQVKQLLLDTAERVPGVNSERQGHGVVNPGPALARALRVGGPLSGLPLSGLRSNAAATFYFHAARAKPDSVIGDFNDWAPGRHPFVRLSDGVYHCTVTDLPTRVCRYKFLLEDGSWTDDPENPLKEPDGYGSLNSKLPRP